MSYYLSRLFILLSFASFFSHKAFSQYSMRDFNRSSDRMAYLNFLAYKKAKSEGKDLRKWWHGESGLGLIFTGPVKFTMRSRYDSVANTQGPYHDTTLRASPKMLLSFNAYGSAYYRLITGYNKCLSFSFGLNASYMRWQVNSFNGSELTQVQEKVYSTSVGMPLTLEYKMGGDVEFDKSVSYCFSVGGGAILEYEFNTLQFSETYVQFKTRPYFYATAGFYLGRMWKVRAAFIPSNHDVFKDVESVYGLTKTTLNMSYGTQFMISIATMAYSNDWQYGGGSGHKMSHFQRLF